MVCLCSDDGGNPERTTNMTTTAKILDHISLTTGATVDGLLHAFPGICHEVLVWVLEDLEAHDLVEERGEVRGGRFKCYWHAV